VSTNPLEHGISSHQGEREAADDGVEAKDSGEADGGEHDGEVVGDGDVAEPEGEVREQMPLTRVGKMSAHRILGMGPKPMTKQQK
jgi:hypothetical protein